jgi:2-dehydropantoate 2-reductase
MALDETHEPGVNGRRYVIIGAGAIGGTVGGVLARAGAATVLVARGPHAETLATTGLTLRTPDGTFRTPVAAVSGADHLRLTSADVLVFTTKTQQLDAALQEWVDQPVHSSDGVAGTAGDLLPALTALNGVVAEEKALRYFRQAPLRTPADDEFLQQLAQTWSPAGIRVNPVDDVAPWKYNKLLSNLGNAVGALSAEDADISGVTAALRAEGEQVLRHAGIEFISFEVSTAARVDGPTPRSVPGSNTGASNSTWQSLSRNTGNVETDYFNGEIVRIAHQHGTAAPLNAALARASRDAVRNRLGPSHFSAAQLSQLLGIP